MKAKFDKRLHEYEFAIPGLRPQVRGDQAASALTQSLHVRMYVHVHYTCTCTCMYVHVPVVYTLWKDYVL